MSDDELLSKKVKPRSIAYRPLVPEGWERVADSYHARSECAPSIGALDVSSGDAFADLVERSNGIYGGCW